MQTVWNTGSYHVRMIWQPEWRTPVLPLPPQPAGTSLTNLVASNKAEQVGWKLDHSGTGMDWSVSYAHCINRTPDLMLLAVRPQSAALGLAYHFADVVGADAAVPIGRYGLRGNETLELELGAAIWFKKRDSIVTMKLSFNFTDRIKGILGTNIWSGPADSFFGRLSHTTTAFIEVRYGL